LTEQQYIRCAFCLSEIFCIRRRKKKPEEKEKQKPKHTHTPQLKQKPRDSKQQAEKSQWKNKSKCRNSENVPFLTFLPNCQTNALQDFCRVSDQQTYTLPI